MIFLSIDINKAKQIKIKSLKLDQFGFKKINTACR